MLVFDALNSEKVEQKYAEPKVLADRSGWTWKAAQEFRQTDFLVVHSGLSVAKWKELYGSFSVDEVLMFFELIEAYFKKPKDDRIMKRNKFLLWLNFVHADVQNYGHFSRAWCGVSRRSLNNYCNEVLKAILQAFNGTPEIVDCPMNDVIRKKMQEILELNNDPMSIALLSIDGKASQLYGRKHRDRRCYKFKFRPAQNHMSIYDRVLGLAVASSIGNGGNNNDKGIFNQHHWSNSLHEKLCEYLMLADSGL